MAASVGGDEVAGLGRHAALMLAHLSALRAAGGLPDFAALGEADFREHALAHVALELGRGVAEVAAAVAAAELVLRRKWGQS